MFNKNLLQRLWSPYVVGLCLGVLSWITFGLMGHMLGTSTTFVRIAAAFWSIFSPSHFANSIYYRRHLANNSWINWQFALIIGLFIGSYLAKKLSGSKEVVYVPKLWKKAFGSSFALRAIAAFIGGVFVMFGARFAGGCASGHGLSGSMQLALSGWLFMMGLFIVGIPTALLLYKRSN
ncbi:YeeE/YedE family protein [bacterium]|jgi:uncharacterized protein|nr:YeeE/YedE family protein [bacterium]MBT6048291.1 YeeE/YedE family protein [Candidatus Scalindua sp.]MBT3903690.1 YeeE/YedE family protein [bacterium]MBT4577576.1 YeeE/YedE family protein [bacterium]MBT5345736.1 YeeE/YedE family protein [bacterium]